MFFYPKSYYDIQVIQGLLVQRLRGGRIYHKDSDLHWSEMFSWRGEITKNKGFILNFLYLVSFAQLTFIIYFSNGLTYIPI